MYACSRRVIRIMQNTVIKMNRKRRSIRKIKQFLWPRLEIKNKWHLKQMHRLKLWHMSRCSQKLNHGLKTMLVLMKFLMIRSQRYMTSEIWMDTISLAKSETNSTVVHVMLFHLSKPLSPELNWSMAKTLDYHLNTYSLVTISMKAVKVAGPWWMDTLRKMAPWSMKNVVNTLEQLWEAHAPSLLNVNLQQELKRATSLGVQQILRLMKRQYRKNWWEMEL